MEAAPKSRSSGKLMRLWEEADFETGELLLLSIGVTN
jgi:hypothetical protein